MCLIIEMISVFEKKVEDLTGSPTYFLAGNIAKQKWCHFEAIIRCRENEDLARRNVEKIKERGLGAITMIYR